MTAATIDRLSPDELKKLTETLGAEKARRDLRVRAVTDFKEFAENFLHIRTKSGVIRPLTFNKAQLHIHEALEKQRASTGKVRALILKARQMGCSTYIGGRLYRVINGRGLRCFILTHEDAATQNLFEMVSRYHQNMAPDIKLEASTENAKELSFASVDGGYRVGTARTTGVGRSSTLQLLHGSEVAFWQHAEAHASGVLQAVANEPGTEVILESTANGVGGFFHQKWREAESGDSEYIAVFTPWFWDESYRIKFEGELRLTPEEDEYRETYGLDLEQMAFRRNKISELGDELLFKQEYSANAAEAFQLTGHDAFISPQLVTRARKSNHEASGPLVIGFDPSWLGGDRSAMAWRRGRRVIKVEVRKGLDTMSSAGWCRKVIAEDKPAKMFLDVGGVGAGVSDRLQEMGLGSKIEAVNFGSSPIEPAPLDDNGKPFGGPANRRAEMWLNMKKWLEGAEGVTVPDKDELQADVCGPSYKYDSNTRLLLEKKEDMRRRGVPSPDIGDAIALTFARPIAPPRPPYVPWRNTGGNWMST